LCTYALHHKGNNSVKKYLFSSIEEIKNRVAEVSHCVLFLDYDGTLVPICKEPSLARLSLNTRNVIKDLLRNPFLSVGVISGRSLKEIRKMVGIRNLLYAGNHGFEMYFKDRTWTHPELEEFTPRLKKVVRELRNRTGEIAGVLVEDKKFTASIHYRNVTSHSPGSLRAVINDILAPYPETFTLFRGKKVFEIRPCIEWNKGKALERLTELLAIRTKLVRIYIGDDQTDEDAFSALGKGDIAIRVGSKKGSRARYYCRSSSEVVTFLKMLHEELEGRS
jgi:alpha,alpha-trehalase